MSVKRYDMSDFGDGMVEREDGAYYYMDDYHDLQYLNAELLEALENMANEFQRVYPIYYYAEPWGHETNAPLLAAKALIAKARSQA